MKKVLVLLCLTLLNLAHAQDCYRMCDDRKVNCENGNKNHFAMVSHCPYSETDTTHIPKNSVELNRKYLVQRVGSEFYALLNYYSCQEINFENYVEIKKTKPWIDKKMLTKERSMPFNIFCWCKTACVIICR